jgi:hypothetical protein
MVEKGLAPIENAGYKEQMEKLKDHMMPIAETPAAKELLAGLSELADQAVSTRSTETEGCIVSALQEVRRYRIPSKKWAACLALFDKLGDLVDASEPVQFTVESASGILESDEEEGNISEGVAEEDDDDNDETSPVQSGYGPGIYDEDEGAAEEAKAEQDALKTALIKQNNGMPLDEKEYETFKWMMKSVLRLVDYSLLRNPTETIGYVLSTESRLEETEDPLERWAAFYDLLVKLDELVDASKPRQLTVESASDVFKNDAEDEEDDGDETGPVQVRYRPGIYVAEDDGILRPMRPEELKNVVLGRKATGMMLESAMQEEDISRSAAEEEDGDGADEATPKENARRIGDYSITKLINDMIRAQSADNFASTDVLLREVLDRVGKTRYVRPTETEGLIISTALEVEKAEDSEGKWAAFYGLFNKLGDLVEASEPRQFTIESASDISGSVAGEEDGDGDDEASPVQARYRPGIYVAGNDGIPRPMSPKELKNLAVENDAAPVELKNMALEDETTKLINEMIRVQFAENDASKTWLIKEMAELVARSAYVWPVETERLILSAMLAAERATDSASKWAVYDVLFDRLNDLIKTSESRQPATDPTDEGIPRPISPDEFENMVVEKAAAKRINDRLRARAADAYRDSRASIEEQKKGIGRIKRGVRQEPDITQTEATNTMPEWRIAEEEQDEMVDRILRGELDPYVTQTEATNTMPEWRIAEMNKLKEILRSLGEERALLERASGDNSKKSY